jgi:RNA polymerase sigma factor (sigma-70 family)
MPWLRNDPRLLSAYRAGEHSALASVYRHYAGPLQAYFRTLARGTGVTELSQPSAIQDLLQEAFLRAFSRQARSAYDARRDFAPYLKVIARNCFVDAIRRRKSELLVTQEHLIELGEPPATDEGYDPDVLATLEAYLASLPPALKDVYEQRFALELSQEVACATLGLSRNSLRTLEARFTRGLRRALAVAGHAPQRSPFATES